MKATSRIRLYFGILVTVVLVGVAFAYLNYTMSRVISDEARLATNTYALTIDYAGVIEEQYVEVGTAVKKGDKLFEIRSAELAEALSSDRLNRSDLLFDLTDDGNIILTATNDGTVRQINFREGSYVPAASPIATVDIAESLHIVATYYLRAPEYSRIDRSNPILVTLPDNTKFEATVFDVAQEEKGQRVATIVRAKVDPSTIDQLVFAPGTPADTTWRMSDSTWYRTVVDLLKKLFIPTSEE